MTPDNLLDALRRTLLALPELRDWPLAESLLVAQRRPDLPIWELPFDACAAVGAPRDRAHAAAAAVMALLVGVHIVDDILDDEPAGLYRRAGAGPVANLALALAAAASRVIASAGFDAEREAAMHRSLAAASLATGFGQNLDIAPPGDEAGYWRIARAKTPPLYSSALVIGALAGGAPVALAESLGALGEPLGLLVQVSDDVSDALERPVQPDWRRPHGNLALLYATLAEHEHRDRFLALLPSIDAPPALAEAQSLLVRCGAVSYCVHHIVTQYRDAARRLRALPLSHPAPLAAVLRAHVAPVVDLLRSVGVAAPESLIEE